MSFPAPSTYAELKAPAEDGKLVVWPEPAQLFADTSENHRSLSAAKNVRVQNVPLSELRRRTREWLGHPDEQPLIADGHQTELYHSGVWVKSVLAHVMAERLSGSAMHLAVDTDAPKHLYLRWPGVSVPITDDADLNKAHWSGLLDGPTPRHLTDLQQRLEQATFVQPPMTGEFLSSLRRLSLEQPKLSSAITDAQHGLDWELGLRHRAVLASPLWMSEPYLLFVHHVVARAAEFAASYNRALNEYRRQKKERTPTRPMPDLTVYPESVELPFWLDSLNTGDRIRPTAFAAEGGFVITLNNGDEFLFDPAVDGWEAATQFAQWLRRHELRLSPRALMLTLFVRLCVADQFIHGIGGAQYDQITDRIIVSHFGLTPPKFSITTATMYLPEALGRSRVCIPCINSEGHRLKHAVLGSRKRELVAAIESAPRRSRERYEAFLTLHRELRGATAAHPAMRQWEQRLRDAQQHEAEEAVVFDREVFYAMQPRGRLLDMIDRYESALGV